MELMRGTARAEIRADGLQQRRTTGSRCLAGREGSRQNGKGAGLAYEVAHWANGCNSVLLRGWAQEPLGFMCSPNKAFRSWPEHQQHQ
jgi:hypothetical protein